MHTEAKAAACLVEAIEHLEAAEASTGERVFGEARADLELGGAGDAVRALMVIILFCKECRHGAPEPAKVAVRSVRDVVVLRCQLPALRRGDGGDVRAFMQACKES